MPERMSDRMSEWICQIYFQMYVRNYVRIMFLGGDHSKEIFFSMHCSDLNTIAFSHRNGRCLGVIIRLSTVAFSTVAWKRK